MQRRPLLKKDTPDDGFSQARLSISCPSSPPAFVLDRCPHISSSTSRCASSTRINPVSPRFHAFALSSDLIQPLTNKPFPALAWPGQPSQPVQPEPSLPVTVLPNRAPYRTFRPRPVLASRTAVLDSSQRNSQLKSGQLPQRHETCLARVLPSNSLITIPCPQDSPKSATLQTGDPVRAIAIRAEGP